jgi:peroxiredoxin (alkyl hydroperoxide reductase subunit C)
MPLIGDHAPAFHAVTTQGEINFPEDFRGRWVIFFSHPLILLRCVRQNS